jgi:hypothetical protein
MLLVMLEMSNVANLACEEPRLVEQRRTIRRHILTKEDS